MSIETLNEIFLPWVLFVGYFCLACLLKHQAKLYTKVEGQTFSPTISQNQAREEDCLKNTSIPKSYSARLYLKVSELVEQLDRKQIEQVCQNLGIELKGEKEKEYLFFLKAHIKHLFRESPKKVIAALNSQKFD